MARKSLRPALRALELGQLALQARAGPMKSVDQTTIAGLVPRGAASAATGALLCALVALTVFGGSVRHPATRGSTVSRTLRPSAGISTGARVGADAPPTQPA